MNRREFLLLSTATSVVAGMKMSAFAESDEYPPPQVDHKNVKPRNREPYSGIDWTKAHQINTTSHMHQHNDALEVVKKHNLGFVAFSNYYPSAPTCPLSENVYPRGVPVSDSPVMVHGKLRKGPFDWNKIVEPWIAEIPEKGRQAWPPYPFKCCGKLYDPKSIPEGLLEGPNAEHHSFKLADGRSAHRLHMCAPGSAYASGTFDAHDRFRTRKNGGYCSGSGEFWGTAIDRMIENMVYPDGGGVTINHPTWSRLDRDLLLQLLDWDPRVLGIEVMESGVNSEHYWDWALATGRQCYGLFVPDHGLHKKDFGVNVMVVPERTAHACLKAYRDGCFYGAAHGLGELKFTIIEFAKSGVKAATDKPAKFEVLTARGIQKTCEGTSVEWECAKDDGSRNGPATEVFVRIRATALDGCGERLFSQAGMLV